MINVSELESSVKKGLKAAYFIKGDDLYLVDYAKSVLKSLVTDGADEEFAVEVFEDFSEPDEILAVLDTPSFFSELKLVLVKEASKANDKLIERLGAYLADPNPSSVLAVVVSDDSFKSLYKAGEQVVCNHPDAPEASRFVVSEVQKNGFEITPPAVRLLVEYTARDLARANSELWKLYAFSENKKITDADVKALVAPDTEFQIYELTNALSRGDNKKVLAVYNALLARGEKGATLLSLLENQYRRVFHTALNQGKRDEEIAAYFGVKPYSVKVARDVAARYTQQSLKKIVDMLTELEYSFKSGKMTDTEAVDYAVSYLIKKEKN